MKNKYPKPKVMIRRMVKITFKKFPSLAARTDSDPMLYYPRLTIEMLKAEYDMNFCSVKYGKYAQMVITDEATTSQHNEGD